MYPSYENLNLSNYETLFGYYTLGYIKYHRPDLVMIDIRLSKKQWNCPHDLVNYDWLDTAIQQGLSEHRTVIIIPEDEHVVFTVNKQLSKILNKYSESAVYWITMLDSASQKIYRDLHRFRIKILELPWVLLNDCLTYYPVANTITSYDSNEKNYNFFCLIGNTARHKSNLALRLHAKKLNRYGLITINKNWAYDKDLLEFCQVNEEVVYDPAINPDYPMIASQVQINGTWVSQNVTNYLYIDQKYHHIPLAINPETTTNDFKSTEKSIWPILLGKLFLLYGRPGTMAWVQRFYDIDISTFANVAYDSIPGADLSGPQPLRLHRMIDDNYDLIVNATDIYNKLKIDLEDARWTFGRNLYKFFVSQLELIV